ncbi:MAG: leucine-rich repeat protein, partial [Clostridia bacterium]|nr:leucine-rich repeat protein [Clostridia bacterium]
TVVSLIPAPGQSFKFGANALPDATVSPNMNIYIPDGDTVRYQTAWSRDYSYVGVYNAILTEVGDDYVITANESGSARVVLIKYVSTTLKAEVQINTSIAVKMADYALPRTLSSLEFDISIENIGALPFNGVTRLSSLTIRRAGTVYMAPEELMWLIENNTALNTINTISSVAMADLIGGKLPNHIETVNVIAGETAIANEFLMDNVNVKNITINGVALEESNDNMTVGTKAFRNTGWMNALTSDYVVVFDGVLIDVKSSSPVLTIPDNVKSINGGLFEGNEQVEVIFLPSTVASIGEKAFYGATKLTKVFVANTAAPVVGANAFGGNAIGMQAFAEGIYALGNVTTVDATGATRVISDVGDDVYAEYVIMTDGTLLLARKYKNSSYEEITDVVIPSKVDGIDVVSLGNNVLMSAVKNVSLDLAFQRTANSFSNLVNNVNTITVRYSQVDGVVVDNVNIAELINELNAVAIAYDGQVTLSDLLSVSAGDSKVSSLTAVKIIEDVKTTVADLLKDWMQITSVTYPTSIERVAAGSLEDTAWFINHDSDFVVLGGVLLYRYKGSASSTIVPAEVMIVNERAFADKSTLSRLSFAAGSNAHTILDYAFINCAVFASITLPDSMTYIEPNAFDGTKFTYVNDCLIISGSDDAGEILVHYKGTATEFVIPNTIKKISAKAFEGNTTLVKLTYDKDSTYILSTICEDAFKNCTNLETVELPSSVVSVGEGAFDGTKYSASQQ